MNSIAQEGRLTAVISLHMPHAIVLRLLAHLVDAVILTPETVDKVGVLSSSLCLSVGFSIQDEVTDVAWFAPQEAHYHGVG